MLRILLSISGAPISYFLLYSKTNQNLELLIYYLFDTLSFSPAIKGWYIMENFSETRIFSQNSILQQKYTSYMKEHQERLVKEIADCFYHNDIKIKNWVEILIFFVFVIFPSIIAITIFLLSLFSPMKTALVLCVTLLSLAGIIIATLSNKIVLKIKKYTFFSCYTYNNAVRQVTQSIEDIELKELLQNSHSLKNEVYFYLFQEFGNF